MDSRLPSPSWAPPSLNPPSRTVFRDRPPLRSPLDNSKLRRKWKLFDKQEAKKQKAIKGSKT